MAKRSRKKSGKSGIFSPFNLLLASAALALAGQYFLFTRRLLALGVIFYAAAGVLFIMTGAGLKEKTDAIPEKDEERRPKTASKAEIYVFLAVMLAAVFFRVFMINEIPSGCYRDEGQNGNEAINIMNGVELEGTKLPVYIERFTQNAAMYMYPIAAMFKIFGIGVLQIRVVSVIFGILTVAAFYFLLRNLYGWKLAAAGAFILAVLRWHVNFSRVGFLGSLTVLIFVIVLYFLVRAVKNGKLSYFVMAGAATSLSLYSYIAARLIPVGIIIFGAFMFFKNNRFIRVKWMKIALGVLAAVIVLAPLGSYVIKNREAFMTRTATVSIFNHDMLKAIGGRYVNDKGQVKPWMEMYAHNVWTTMLMFNYIGDGNPRHNYNTRPQLDYITGIVFVLGIFLILSQGLSVFGFLFMALFISLLQAGLFSIESPQAYRTIAVIPLVVLAVVAAMKRIRDIITEKFGKNSGNVLIKAAGILLAGVPYNNYNEYFNGWAKDSGAWAEFSMDEYSMGRYVHSLGDGYQALVMPSWLDSYTYNFATYPYKNSVKFDPSEWIPIRAKIFKNFVYILDTSYLPLKPVLQGMYPNGKYVEFRHKYGERLLWWAFEVPYDDVKHYQDKPVKNGLTGYYYRDNEKLPPKELSSHWQGRPVFTRLDPFILFNWVVDPIMGPFSVKWTGRIKIDKPGTYVFSTNSNDYSDVTVNGKRVVTNPGAGGGLKSEEGSIYLDAGYHDIMVRYYESVHYSKMQFFWRAPGGTGMEVVPSEILFPQ